MSLPQHIAGALRLAMVYALFGLLWILFSDTVLNWMVKDADLLTRLQTLKGWFFILVTAILLFALATRSMLSIDQLNKADPLTQLPKHRQFSLLLDEKIARLPAGNKLYLIYMDICQFASINEALGHDTADELLLMVANRLREQYSARDILARVGTDKFAIALETDTDEPRIDQEIKNLKAIFNQTLGEYEQTNGITIGIALAPDDGETARELMQSATSALNSARQSGPNTVYFFNTDFFQREAEKLALVADLRESLRLRTLSLVYQPQFNCTTLDITGVEVLVRWNHPEQGMIRPDHFVKLAEEYGLIENLTHFVIEQSASELLESGLLGRLLNRISINISAREFSDPEHIQRLLDYLRSQTDFYRYVRLEITETAALDDLAGSRKSIDRYRQVGITFSIDDFGTGYSSLAILKDLPIDEIKIDRSFILDMLQHEKSLAIVEAVIAMANSFGINVVAEGVEEQKHLDKLRDIGCNDVQGYLLSKPLPIQTLKPFINQYTAASHQQKYHSS